MNRIIFTVLFILTTIFSMPVHADTQEKKIFKSSEFLTWDRQNQELYMRTSFGMAAFVVNQYNSNQGKCLNDWFANDEQAAYERFLDTMKRFPEYHPRGTIVAVMEKECGKFQNN